MATIQSCLRESERLQAVSDTARLDAEILLAKVIEKDRTYLYTWPEKQLSQHQLAQYQRFLSRRESGEPIAYITGSQEFYSLELAVNTSTLIPRPETELLVDIALELLESDSDKKCLDLGTGTGAIALAIASQRASWHITALEKQVEAVTLAQANRQRLNINNVNIIQSDWFTALKEGHDQFDIIVSNPPYIDKNDVHLSQGDVRFEPSSALVSGDSGLQDILNIIQMAPRFMHSGAWLLLEHGYQQADAVAALFKRFAYSNIILRRDLAGQARVTGAQFFAKVE